MAKNPKRGYRIIRPDENLWAGLKLPPKPPPDPEWVKRILELERQYVLEYRRRKLDAESL